MDGRDHRHHRGGENRRRLTSHEGRDEEADPGRYGHVEQGGEGESRKVPGEGHAEDNDSEGSEEEEVRHREDDVRNLLAEQKLESSDRRHVEVDDRAELLLADHAERRQVRGNQKKQQRDDRGHHGDQALEAWIVAVSYLELGLAHQTALSEQLAHLSRQPLRVRQPLGRFRVEADLIE